MWQVFDENQILHHTLSKLSNSVCANSNRIPDAAEGMSNKNKKEQEHRQSQQKFQSSVAASFAQMSQAQLSQQILEQNRELRQLRRELVEETDSETLVDIRDMIATARDIIKQLKNTLAPPSDDGDNEITLV